jgi:8-oxo-dGTP diphosphatase
VADVPYRPGVLRRTALRGYGRLPRRVRLALLHALAPSYTVGALCVIEHVRSGRILLLRQHHRRGWTLPGGLLDRGESAARAVVREVREETGLAIEVGLPFGVVVEPGPRRVDVLFHVPTELLPTPTASSEATHAAWLTIGEAGPFDEPTSQAFAMFARYLTPGAHRGRLDPEAKPDAEDTDAGDTDAGDTDAGDTATRDTDAGDTGQP